MQKKVKGKRIEGKAKGKGSEIKGRIKNGSKESEKK